LVDDAAGVSFAKLYAVTNRVTAGNGARTHAAGKQLQVPTVA
jgi:hypothetical protein